MGDMTLGVIGTGIIGGPVAKNLARAGHKVLVHNRTREKTADAVAAGAQWIDSPSGLAEQADCVLTVLPDSPDVEAVYLGRGGVLQMLRANTLCVDMSTIAPDVAKHIAAEVRKRGAAFLDAPVSGGKTGAVNGTLTIMVGGNETDLARVKPILEVIGRTIIRCGPVGHGQLTKLCNQVLCGLNLLAVSEAVVLAKRVGLDPSVMLEVVSTGAAGSWAVDHLGPRMLARDFAPMFMVDLQQKDLRIALSAARDANLPLPGTALVSQLLAANQAAGEGREGTQALVKTLERLGKGQ
jgi:3-hydroxyisobutyrate dehydrogenase